MKCKNALLAAGIFLAFALTQASAKEGEEKTAASRSLQKELNRVIPYPPFALFQMGEETVSICFRVDEHHRFQLQEVTAVNARMKHYVERLLDKKDVDVSSFSPGKLYRLDIVFR